MFRDDLDSRYVYRIRGVSLVVFLVLLTGSFGAVVYLGMLQPFVLPLGDYFYLLDYSFGLKLVYLTLDITLATFFVATPLTMFLVAIFMSSWVLIVLLLWDFDLFRFILKAKECEHYGNAKALIRSFAEREKKLVTLNRILFVAVFLSIIPNFLSYLMFDSQGYSLELSLILAALPLFTVFLYGINIHTVKERLESFIQNK